MKLTPSSYAVMDCYVENIPDLLIEPMIKFIEGVDMRQSGSGIEYLGHNAFGIYDYPAAEQWTQETSWPNTLYRLGDGTFHTVEFKEHQAAVEFKLRWGRQVVKKNA